MKNQKEPGTIKRRDFIKKAGVGAAAVAATAVNAPFVHAAKKTTIKWRMQTYAGAALSAHVCKPAIDAFNKALDAPYIVARRKHREIFGHYPDELTLTFLALQKDPGLAYLLYRIHRKLDGLE